MSWILLLLGAFLALLGGLMLLVWGRDPAVVVSASVPGQVASDPDTTARAEAELVPGHEYLGGAMTRAERPEPPAQTLQLCHLWWESDDNLRSPDNPLSAVHDRDHAALRHPGRGAMLPIQARSAEEAHFVAPSGHKGVAPHAYGSSSSELVYPAALFPLQVPCWLGEPSSVGGDSRRGLFMRTYTSRTAYTETTGASIGQLDYFVAFTYQQTAETPPSPQPTGEVVYTYPVASLEFDDGAVVQVLSRYKVRLKDSDACVPGQTCRDQVIDEQNPIDGDTHERLLVRIRSSGFDTPPDSESRGNRTVEYRVPRMRPGYTRQVELRVDLLDKCPSASMCGPDSYSPIVVDGVEYPATESSSTGGLSEYGIAGMVRRVSSGNAFRLFSLYAGFQRFPELHDARREDGYWHNHYLRPAAVLPTSRAVVPFGDAAEARLEALYAASNRPLPPSDARVSYRQEYTLALANTLRYSAAYDARLASSADETNRGVLRLRAPSNVSAGFSPPHAGYARYALSFRSARPLGDTAYAFRAASGGIVSVFVHQSGPWSSLGFPAEVAVSLWGGTPHPAAVTTLDSSADFGHLPFGTHLVVSGGNDAPHFVADTDGWAVTLTGRQHAYDASLDGTAHALQLQLVTEGGDVVGRQEVRVRLAEYRNTAEVGAPSVRHGSTAAVQRVLVDKAHDAPLQLQLELPANWPDEARAATTAHLEMLPVATLGSGTARRAGRARLADSLAASGGGSPYVGPVDYGPPATMQLAAAATTFAVAEPESGPDVTQTITFRYVVRHGDFERHTEFVQVRWLGGRPFAAETRTMPQGNLPLYPRAAAYAGTPLRELRVGDAVAWTPSVHFMLRDVMRFRFEPLVQVTAGGPAAGGAGETSAQALSRIGLSADAATGTIAGTVSSNYHALWPIDVAVLPVFTTGTSVVTATGALLSSGEALHPVAALRLHVVGRLPFTFGTAAGDVVATRQTDVLLRPAHTSPGVAVRVVATSDLGGALVSVDERDSSVRLRMLPDGREVSLVLGWQAPEYPVLPPADASRREHTETLVVRSVRGTALEATAIGEPEPGETLTADGELVQFDLLPPSSGTPAPVPEDVVEVSVEYPSAVEFALGVPSQSVMPVVLLRSRKADGTGTLDTPLEPAEHRSYVAFEADDPHVAVDPHTGELRPADPRRLVPLGSYAATARLTAGPAGGAHVSSVLVRSRGAFRYVNEGVPVAANVGAALAPRGPLFSAAGYTLQNFRLAAGALPPGVQLDQTTGVLAGTPSLQGDFSAEMLADAVDNGGTVFRDGFRAAAVDFAVQAERVTVVDPSDPTPTAPDPTDKNADAADGGARRARLNPVGYVGISAMACGAAASVASLFVGKKEPPRK